MDAAGDETSPVPLSAPPYSRPRHRRRRVQQLRRQDGRRAGSGCGALGVLRHFGQPYLLNNNGAANCLNRAVEHR